MALLHSTDSGPRLFLHWVLTMLNYMALFVITLLSISLYKDRNKLDWFDKISFGSLFAMAFGYILWHIFFPAT